LTAYKKRGYRIEDFPETWDKYQNEISLPVYYNLADDQVETVINAVKHAVKKVIG
jgi:dTDP-4-amino-4,6-dideoxygalactose transaminase